MFHNDAPIPFQEFDFKFRYLIGPHQRMRKSRYGQYEGQGCFTYQFFFKSSKYSKQTLESPTSTSSLTLRVTECQFFCD